MFFSVNFLVVLFVNAFFFFNLIKIIVNVLFRGGKTFRILQSSVRLCLVIPYCTTDVEGAFSGVVGT